MKSKMRKQSYCARRAAQMGEKREAFLFPPLSFEFGISVSFSFFLTTYVFPTALLTILPLDILFSSVRFFPDNSFSSHAF